MLFIVSNIIPVLFQSIRKILRTYSNLEDVASDINRLDRRKTTTGDFEYTGIGISISMLKDNDG